LSAQEGDQIASYSRTLNAPAAQMGRPWNPAAGITKSRDVILIWRPKSDDSAILSASTPASTGNQNRKTSDENNPANYWSVGHPVRSFLCRFDGSKIQHLFARLETEPTPNHHHETNSDQN
jgi:hypothetical protein